MKFDRQTKKIEMKGKKKIINKWNKQMNVGISTCATKWVKTNYAARNWISVEKKNEKSILFFFRGLPTAGIPPFSLTSIVILSNQFQFQFSAEILSIISTPIVSNQNKSEKWCAKWIELSMNWGMNWGMKWEGGGASRRIVSAGNWHFSERHCRSNSN